MILTDGIHLMSDESVIELHEFAARIGLKRCWFQNHSNHPHYDLTTSHKVSTAVLAGAKRVSATELVKKCSFLFRERI